MSRQATVTQNNRDGSVDVVIWGDEKATRLVLGGSVSVSNLSATTPRTSALRPQHATSTDRPSPSTAPTKPTSVPPD